MDIYVSGSSFRQDPKLVEGYESLIWTEKFQDVGNFEMVIPETPYFTKLLSGKYLTSSTTSRVMMVETVGVPKQVQGRSLMKVTGRSIENILQYRSAKHNQTQQSTTKESFTGTVAEIAKYMVQKYAVDAATAGGANVIPGLTAANDVGTGTVLTLELDRKDILGMVRDLCQAADLGFRMVRMPNGNLRFSIYQGEDKSVKTSPNYTRYSADNDSLIDTSYIESVANFKNNVRMLGKNTYVDVFAKGYDANTSGFDRRTFVVEADDVDTGNIAQDQDILRQMGLRELADVANRYTKLVDGEVPPRAVEKFKPQLGDIVDLMDKYGNPTRSLITELIWSTDAEGSGYSPTFQALL